VGKCNLNFNLAAAIVVIISILIYLPSLNGDFVWDDISLIKYNKNIDNFHSFISNIFSDFWEGTDSDNKSGYFRPFINFTYFLDRFLYKDNPAGFHVTNIIFNSLSVFAIIFLFYNFTKNVKGTALAGLIFALHPVHVEAVAWISGRTDVIATCFSLWAFYFYLKFVSKREFIFSILSGILFLLGLFSKEIAVTLLIIVPLYDFLVNRKIQKRTWLILFVYIALFLVYLLMRFFALKGSFGGSPHGYFGTGFYSTMLTMVRVFVRYILLSIIPYKLCPDYGLVPSISMTEHAVVSSGVLLLIFVLVGWYFIRKTRLFAFLYWWFFIGLLPVSNIVPIDALMAERYLYFPTAGFAMLVALFIIRVNVKLKFSLKALVIDLILFIILAFYSIKTVNHIYVFKDEKTLFKATVKACATSPRAHYNYGTALAKSGHIKESIPLLSKAILLKPDYPQAHMNLAKSYEDIGNLKKAEEHYKLAIKYRKNFHMAHNNLGNVYFAQKKYKQALAEHLAAFKFLKTHSGICTNVAMDYEYLGKYEQAEKFYKLAIKLDKHSKRVLRFYAKFLEKRGQVFKALNYYLKAFDLTKSVPFNKREDKVCHDITALFLKVNKIKEAFDFYFKNKELENCDYCTNNIGIGYAKLGNFNKAMEYFKKALKISPTFPDALLNAGITARKLGDLDSTIKYWRRFVRYSKNKNQVANVLKELKKLSSN